MAKAVKSLMPKENRAICLRIAALRAATGMTQAEFGDAMGLSRVTIKQIELCHQLPTIATLRLISQTFKVSYSFLIDGK